MDRDYIRIPDQRTDPLISDRRSKKTMPGKALILVGSVTFLQSIHSIDVLDITSSPIANIRSIDQ